MLSQEEIFEALVDRIANNHAIAYVGAGASTAARLPQWDELNRRFIEKHHDRMPPDEQEHVWELYDSGDLPLLAEAFKHRRAGEYMEHLRKELGVNRKPTSIHQALARMPFRMFMTTNYDSLLQEAYNEQHEDERKINVRSWQDVGVAWGEVREGQRVVLHLHGAIAAAPTNQSKELIISRKDFIRLLHGNPMLRSVLKAAFLNYSFFFVAHSLRDPDLLSTLSEIAVELERSKVDRAFWPKHFLLLEKVRAQDYFCSMLRESYNIETLTYQVGKPAAGADAAKHHTRQVAKFLDRAAEAVERRRDRNRLLAHRPVMAGDAAADVDPEEGGVEVGRPALLGDILQQAVRTTDSDRGSLFLLDQYRGLSEVVALPASASESTVAPPDSFESRLFWSQDSDNYALLPEPGSRPQEGDRTPRLAYAVRINGCKVGVMEVSRTELKTYGDDDVKTLRPLADAVARVESISRIRTYKGRFLDVFQGKPRLLFNAIRAHRDLRPETVVLYQADYMAGRFARASHPASETKRAPHFGSQTLAAYVMRHGSQLIRDLDDAEARPKLDREAARKAGAKAPMAALALDVEDVRVGVLIAWEIPNLDGLERVVRLVIADHEPMRQRPLELLKKLTRIVKQHKNPDRRRTALLKTLVGAGAELLDRIRWWRWNGQDFVCEWSHGRKGGHQLRGTVAPATGDGANPYCRLLLERYRADPFAALRIPDLVYGPDPQAKSFGKQRDREWVIAPVLRPDGELAGFVAGDTQPDGRELAPGDPSTEYLLKAMDVVTDYLGACEPVEAEQAAAAGRS